MKAPAGLSLAVKGSIFHCRNDEREGDWCQAEVSVYERAEEERKRTNAEGEEREGGKEGAEGQLLFSQLFLPGFNAKSQRYSLVDIISVPSCVKGGSEVKQK